MRLTSSSLLTLYMGSITCWCLAGAAPFRQLTPEALYKRHAWFALQERIASGGVADPLVLGATAAALGHEEAARVYLEPLLTGPNAGEAHTWLSYINLRKGQYKEAALHIESANGDEHDPLAATFRELPDQVTLSTSPANIRYRILQRKLFVPAFINQQPVEFILDSDANLSYVSEATANQLGLSVRHSSATTVGALGAASQLNMANADVVIGKTFLRHVSFMVLPQNASVFATLHTDQQGALGLPVLIALEQFGWDRDGKFEIGSGYEPSHAFSSLALDGADPIVRFSYKQFVLTGVFDTGAETTDLWPPFAARFARMVRRQGTHSDRTIRGFGGDGTVPDMVLPALALNLGGTILRVAPAHVLTGKTTPNSDWLDGRLGLDVMLQAQRVIVDFRDGKVQLIQ